ncbi:MAG TPA: ABATE domain-containing protein [Stellaceae bacterium]|nr:ABATE domain-containing protein [Stellaceae bacterium]
MTEIAAPAELPDSDWAFHFETGRPCLDFVATVGNRMGQAFDRWRDAAGLARWCVEAGLVAKTPSVRPPQLEQARRLREAIYRTIAAVRAGRRPRSPDIEEMNLWAARSGPVPRLDAGGRGVTWSAGDPLEAVLATVARDAIDLLSGPDLERVRECAEASCSVLFVDASRPGRRRWCSMSRCGNKAKKASFRARHRQ